MIFELSQIKHISYVNITRLTFSLLITIQRESEDKEENLEFGMIDQQYYSILDSFIKSQRINDNSFDDELREKVKKGDTIEPEDPLHDEANSNGDKSGLGALMGEDVAASDDEDEDGTYHIGVEEDDSGISASGTDDSDSGSESDVTGVSESEGEEEEGDDDDDEEEEIKKE